MSRLPQCTPGEFEAAVAAAKAAFPAWRGTPVSARARVMFRLQHLINQNMDRLAASVTQEQGKTLADARGDVFRGLGARSGGLLRPGSRQIFPTAAAVWAAPAGVTRGVDHHSAWPALPCPAEVVEYACGIGAELMGEVVENVSAGIDTYSLRQPLGVTAGICPFNFPAMIPLWMFPLATAAGNTMVLKPSEKDPGAAMLLAELAAEAGAHAGPGR